MYSSMYRCCKGGTNGPWYHGVEEYTGIVHLFPTTKDGRELSVQLPIFDTRTLVDTSM